MEPKAYAMTQFIEIAAGDAKEAVVKISGIEKAIEDRGGCKLDCSFLLLSSSGSSGITNCSQISVLITEATATKIGSSRNGIVSLVSPLV